MLLLLLLELLLLLRLFLLLLLLPLLLLLLMLQEVCGLGKGDAGPSSCKGYNSGPAILCTSHKIESPRRMGVRREEEEMVERQLGMVVASKCFWPLV